MISLNSKADHFSNSFIAKHGQHITTETSEFLVTISAYRSKDLHVCCDPLA